MGRKHFQKERPSNDSIPDCAGHTAESRNTARVRAAARALDVFDFFRECKRPATTAEVGRALGIPNSSADDLLKMLLGKGYLARDSRSKRYAPSHRFHRIATEIVSNFPVLERLRDLESALARTGQTVLTAVQDGNDMHVISELNGAWRFNTTREGWRGRLARVDHRGRWMPSTNFAAALLAANSDLEIVETLRQEPAAQSSTNFALLLDDVRSIRERGYAVCQLTESPHIQSFAVWLPKTRTMPSVAIGCVGPFDDLGKNLLQSIGKLASQFMTTPRLVREGIQASIV